MYHQTDANEYLLYQKIIFLPDKLQCHNQLL